MRRVVVSSLLFVTSCGSSTPPPAAGGGMQGKQGMLDQTAIAAKCDAAAKEHDRPFVIEWDATDLASFEAKAGRDTVFVKYTGCKLQVVYGCSDNAIAARFGNYGAPAYTSGTLQGFDIKSESELYAKLPLGAGNLSGRVSAGETLHLKYFVAGVFTSSRDQISRGDLEGVPACKDATHFVWAYNLGAFELDSSAKAASSSEASLGHGGDIASCTTQNQSKCKVPIRLALRPIADTTVATTNPQTSGSAQGGMSMDQYMQTPEGQAQAALMSALAKKAKGDGQGCLDDLERVAKIDPKQLQGSMKENRALCLMMAGKCDEGVKDYRAAIAEDDSEHLKTDKELDDKTRKEANWHCPSSTAKNDPDFVWRAAGELNGFVKTKDAEAVKKKFDDIAKRLPKLDAKDSFGSEARRNGLDALDYGAKFIGDAKGCAAGESLWVTYSRLRWPKDSDVLARERWAEKCKKK